MSCKIVEAGQAAALRPIQWTDAPQSAPASGQEGSPLYFGLPGAPAQLPGAARRMPGSEDLLRELELEAQRREREAYERGAREGQAAAAQALAAQWEARLEQLARAIESLATLRSRIRKEAEIDLVKLSLAIARRILRREVGVDPQALAGVIKACTEGLEAQEVNRVRVHPEYAAAVGGLLANWKANVQVESDPAVGVGGLVFETSRGSVDAGVETQLAEIERGFTELLPREARR